MAASSQGGCQANGYELPIPGFNDGDGGAGGDGGATGDGGGGGNDGGSLFDAGPPAIDACPLSLEVCDERDNDCDGDTDEGFLLLEDPANCGACGNECDLPHTAGTCADGECQYECLPGFYDLDPDAPGCEYQCIETNGGVEACDFADNDCDGEQDEDFNLASDIDNCGGCGQVCNVLHATAECSAGECGFSVCEDGYADVFDDLPGCEYQCPTDEILDQELCNGVDDNCDGVVDEQPIVGMNVPCSDFAQGDTGECGLGVTSCSFGTEVCTGETGPRSEQCDTLDNDCDGDADETFNFLTDPRTCGSCNPCVVPNAVPGCAGGTCTIFACLGGFVDSDDDGDPVEGCDYLCTPSGAEVCDGIDNDCDRDVDENVAAPANLCRIDGACAGTEPECSAGPCNGPVQFRCVYDGVDAESDGCGNLVAQEIRCDEVDGDCDSRVDESFVLKDSGCADGDLGQCAGIGTFVCDDAETGLVCDITDPGADPIDEQCNDEDDDCDGELDEDAPDDMVQIDDGAGGLPTFSIYAYEASRPDATGGNPGSAGHRSCSRPLVQPWRLVSQVEADSVCAAAGLRLCSEAEWQLACETVAGNVYPYGDTYAAQTCNGRDYDADPDVSGNQDSAVPTGELVCTADWGGAGEVFDLSGNVKEWTGTEVGSGAYRVRGGSFDNIAGGLTCDFSFISFDETIEFPNLGFRCCGTP